MDQVCRLLGYVPNAHRDLTAIICNDTTKNNTVQVLHVANCYAANTRTGFAGSTT